MSKKENTLVRARLMALYEHIFRCPVCSLPMNIVNERSLACTANHSFDLSKDGYVHLLPNAKASKYDKELFGARRLINGSGYFAPLLDKLADGIQGSMMQPASAQPSSILDAGSGEGSHLVYLLHKLQFASHRDILAAGMDASKPGIALAAKGNAPVIWCVADLARSPFQDRTFDIICNILSPSNYEEFRRLLAPGGRLVKVIPGPGYLKEFRQVLYGRPGPLQQEKSGETAALFARHFPGMTQQRVRYEVQLSGQHLEAMLRMTPLSWHAPMENIRRLLAQPTFTLTFDFIILWNEPLNGLT
ncbi:methyltransferase domain-containing protein [Paenibacillus sp. HJL G12]|uniref:Methyltransferase domain-containing protein n=1 Tax=Paenibacillus dendrobii TaxID=2691084 RepID=A0A7X3ILJ1_9BACL|nr:methyltransferase domain-containing protein [Paenibacillus dendrobii]MWV45820.1 methyltransferase domain-containing protein [Paenibacillus dendrobii]